MRFAACRGDCNQGRRSCSDPLRCSVESAVLPSPWEHIRQIIGYLSCKWSARVGTLHFLKQIRR